MSAVSVPGIADVAGSRRKRCVHLEVSPIRSDARDRVTDRKWELTDWLIMDFCFPFSVILISFKTSVNKIFPVKDKGNSLV